MTNSYKKESPLAGFAGFGGGAPGLSYKSAATKTYVDDLFSTYIYDGDGNSSHPITNNIDLSGEGGMVWIKRRDGTYDNWLMDSARGGTKMISSNSTAVEATNNAITSFNSDGFTLGDEGQTNAGGTNMASWSFRKAKGFFDVVKYSGTGSATTISHSLGCVPGLIIIKAIDGTIGWRVYHRETGATKTLELQGNYAAYTSDVWNDTAPTSTEFSLKTDDAVNNSTLEYVAYLFAGGESSATTATSVYTDSSGYLGLAQSTDFDLGTSDFTIEAWVRPRAGDRSGNNFYVLSMGYPFLLYYMADGSVPYSGKFVYEGSSTNASMDYMVSGNTGANSVEQNQWNHVAVTRNGSTFRFFLNGELKHTSTSSGTFGTNTVHGLQIGRAGPVGTDYFQGDVSNFRYVLGTALYTDSFKVPTEPLSNVTNTKVLCCQGSATDSATVSPGTITPYNSPSWSADSPFDDPDGFKFGEDGDKGTVKCGSYLGNASSSGPEINLGWEPQWILLKRVSGGTGNWAVFDSMRGIVTAGDDPVLQPDLSDAEYTTTQYLDVTSTGFQLKGNFGQSNASGDTYLYMAIRRPDGYVGKPAEAGTDAFALDTGNSSSTIPSFDSTFAVDFALAKEPASNVEWYAVPRLTEEQLHPNTSGDGNTNPMWGFDSNVGWANASSLNTNYQSWMWKRGQGFDVVAYAGNSVAGRQIFHSLNQVPEMMWVKNRDTTDNWKVYHKDLNGGSSPEDYHLGLNQNTAEFNSSVTWNDTAPTSSVFTLGGHASVNGGDMVAMLFSSVDGISKCGTYTGTDSNPGPTITTGFQPRFIMIKCRNQTGNWVVLDSLRTFDNYSWLNLTNAQSNTLDILDVSSTGFTLKQAYTDTNVYEYIYYAHA